VKNLTIYAYDPRYTTESNVAVNLCWNGFGWFYSAKILKFQGTKISISNKALFAFVLTFSELGSWRKELTQC